jgi:hypothetical protein
MSPSFVRDFLLEKIGNVVKIIRKIRLLSTSSRLPSLKWVGRVEARLTTRNPHRTGLALLRHPALHNTIYTM